MKLGLSGTLTKTFLHSPLTPLLLLAAVLVGIIALIQIPREEEPQISVPMVDIMVNANGLKADDAVELVAKPLETIIKGIDDVEHIYSQTIDDGVTVTARFKVGTDKDIALLRVHETIRANIRQIPIGIPEPLIVGRGINDVPIVVLTLAPAATEAARWDDNGLRAVASELLSELIKVDDVGLSFLVGGRSDQIRVEPDPERLSQYGVTLNQLTEKIENANRAFSLGQVRDQGRATPLMVGNTLQGPADIGMLLLTTQDGRPVYVKDVARVIVGAAPATHRAWQMTRSGDSLSAVPAVSIALAKRKGANAVTVSEEILSRLEAVQGRVVPSDVTVTVTRNYGETALEKSSELLFHLALATVSIVVLITLAIGWRAGVVVAVVIPTTILLTLFAAHLMGYTINRVSLFALIFSIGILVDDAIVVVENIARHWAMPDDRSRLQKAIEGVAEVGNPTIVATLTIVAALLPMMFVSGLMGPYMSPIPANASAAMIFSFFVAVIITPWLLFHIAGKHGVHAEGEGRMGAFYRRLAQPLLQGRRRSKRFLLLVTVATVAVCGLFYSKSVTVKLLPFDNKSEFQVIADLPEGSTLEDTDRVLQAAAQRLASLPELRDVQAYAGTAGPFNFNGLVRHYYLRANPEMGDLQVNLLPKGERSRSSHAIALQARALLADLPMPAGTSLKVVEVPPGPPVQATLLAEVYGPTPAARREAAQQVKAAFQAVPFVVDVDDFAGQSTRRLRVAIDQQALEFHGVEEQAVYDTLSALLGGVSVGYSHRTLPAAAVGSGGGLDPIEIAVALPESDKTLTERLLATPVAGRNGVVELGDVVTVLAESTSPVVYRRDGRFAEMIMADLAGAYEAPIYGMFAVEQQLADAHTNASVPLKIAYHGQPADEFTPTLLWDGEWEITYVTFRDMGAAFGVAIVGIYLLVVAQFGSFRLPLVILVPVPLTLIGIVLGHWLFSAPFTATSMIGFIALAGIIVRNSILLVDFIRHLRADGTRSLRQALVEAGAIRFKPIFLTAVAAMIGAAFILADPIFQGLAISLVFGLASSTALTLLVIPALYVWLRDDGKE